MLRLHFAISKKEPDLLYLAGTTSLQAMTKDILKNHAAGRKIDLAYPDVTPETLKLIPEKAEVYITVTDTETEKLLRSIVNGMRTYYIKNLIRQAYGIPPIELFLQSGQPVSVQTKKKKAEIKKVETKRPEMKEPEKTASVDDSYDPEMFKTTTEDNRKKEIPVTQKKEENQSLDDMLDSLMEGISF